MKTVMNVAEAKAKLSELIDRALRGEEVWIARNGVPVVRVTPSAHLAADPKPGRRAFFGALAEYGPVPEAALRPEPLDAILSERPIEPETAFAERANPFRHDD